MFEGGDASFGYLCGVCVLVCECGMSVYDSIRVRLCVSRRVCLRVHLRVCGNKNHSVRTPCEKSVSYIYIQASAGSLRRSLWSLR